MLDKFFMFFFTQVTMTNDGKFTQSAQIPYKISRKYPAYPHRIFRFSYLRLYYPEIPRNTHLDPDKKFKLRRYPRIIPHCDDRGIMWLISS